MPTLIKPEQAVAAILGEVGQVYAIRLPAEPVYPCMTYNLISSVHAHDLEAGAGIFPQRYQIDCYRLSLGDATTLAESLRLSLQGASAVIVGDPPDEEGEIPVVYAMLDSEQLFVEEIDNGNPARLYRKSVDYIITFREAQQVE